jgi:hypothetical protein
MEEALSFIRTIYLILGIDDLGYDPRKPFKRTEKEYFHTLYEYFDKIATCVDYAVCSETYAKALFCPDVLRFITVFQWSNPPDGEWGARDERVSTRFVNFAKLCPEHPKESEQWFREAKVAPVH